MTKPQVKLGLNGLISLYSLKFFLKGAIYPFLITVLVQIAIYSFSIIDMKLIEKLSDIITSVVPSLLGFVLSGYALLIGFGNIESLASKPLSGGVSLYQKLSAVFAVGLFVQIFLLAFALATNVLIKANLNLSFFNHSFLSLVKSVLFFVLVFGLLYVTLLIKDLVINIFNFSQIQQYLIDKKNNKSSNAV